MQLRKTWTLCESQGKTLCSSDACSGTDTLSRRGEAATRRGYLDEDIFYRITKAADDQPTPLGMSTPKVASPGPTTPSRISRLTPRRSVVEVQPTIHRELRDFNRPGLKERVIDVTAPRQTRSGTKYTIDNS